MKWAGNVARVEEVKNRYKIFVPKLDGKSSRGRP